jgi:hypothetical protein
MSWIQAAAENWLQNCSGQENSGRPSIIAGWTFLSVNEAEDPDALPIRTVVSSDGPELIYHPQMFPRSMIEESQYAMMWLPMMINHIACSILQASTSATDCIGRYTSDRWQAFRDHVSTSMSMAWNDIVKAARIDGITDIADHITASLFVEDGLQYALAARVVGRESLKVV